MIYQYTLGIIESILETVFTILIGISNSYFMSLVLLAILVRFATKPLEKYVNCAMSSQAEIESVLTPQIDAIKRKHTGVERHNVIKRLYARYSYHPVFAIRSLAGIGVQLPFFIAAYFMLSGYSKLNGVVIPVLGDLGKPDTLLFGGLHLMPFVMTLVNIIALLTMPKLNRKSLIQGLFISLMFLVLLYQSALGLLIYWTTSNLFSLISNFASTINKKIKLKKSGIQFKDTFFGRIFEEYAYLFFITNLAISIPLLGVLGEQFNFFTAHSLSSKFIITLLLIIGLAPTLFLAVLRWVSKRISIVKVFDWAILFVFLGLFLFYSLNKVGYGFFPSKYEPYILFFLALALTIIAVIFISNKQFLRNLSYFSLFIPLVFLNFIFVSPASSLFKYSEKALFPEISNMNDTPIFLLIFDEFSGLTLQNLKGQLDKSRYPGFAELASQADYFPNALTAEFHSAISVPSIASGNLRIKNKIGTGLAPGENLIELFKAKGEVEAYSTVLPADLMSKQNNNQSSVSSDLMTLYIHIINHQTWIEEKIGAIPQAWKGFGIFFSNDQNQDKESAINPHAKEMIDMTKQINDSWTNAQFNFMHFQFPHKDYNTTSLGRFVSNSVTMFKAVTDGRIFAANQSVLNVLSHNYIQQSAYSDTLLQSFIQTLKHKNLFEKSMIIVTTDHGVSYNQKGLYRRLPYTQDSWKNIISVPLFIKYPFQKEGHVNESFVTTFDISTTILKVAGIDSPWKSIGQNLKGIENNSQSQSVKFISGYNKFFKNINTLFQESRNRKTALFGEASPVQSIAVNYTENSIYDNLLMTNITELNVAHTSNLTAVFDGPLDAQEISHYGAIFQGQKYANNKVLAAVVEGEIQAVFKSGKVRKMNGFFAFSLPENEIIPSKVNISLYEIESVAPFVLRKLENKNQQTFLEQGFQNKTIYTYDWLNSVHSSNGLDSLNVDKGGIQIMSKRKDPFIVFKPISKKVIYEPIFHIRLESSRDLSFQIFYQTKENKNFNRSQIINYKIKKGSNSFYIKIPGEGFFGHFRFDFGNENIATKVVIQDIEIRN